MIHGSAETGYSKASDTYVSGRPDYPVEVDVWLREALGLRDGVTVLDLGAGTGKFTKRLVQTGALVSAVEPVAAMREKLGALAVYRAADCRIGLFGLCAVSKLSGR